MAVCARDEGELERAQAILSEKGAEIMVIPCDLTDRDQALDMMKQVTTRFGRVSTASFRD